MRALLHRPPDMLVLWRRPLNMWPLWVSRRTPIDWSSVAAMVMIVASSARKVRRIISVMIPEVEITSPDEIETDSSVNIIRIAHGRVRISIIDGSGNGIIPRIVIPTAGIGRWRSIIITAGIRIGSSIVIPAATGRIVNTAAASREHEPNESQNHKLRLRYDYERQLLNSGNGGAPF